MNKFIFMTLLMGLTLSQSSLVMAQPINASAVYTTYKQCLDKMAAEASAPAQDCLKKKQNVIECLTAVHTFIASECVAAPVKCK